MNNTFPLALCMGLSGAIMYVGFRSLQQPLSPAAATFLLLVSPIALFMVFESVSVLGLAFYLLTKALLVNILLTPAFVGVASFAALVYICSKVVDEKGEHVVQCI
jgi:hypothetical protein